MAWISILTGSRAGETLSLDETNYVVGSDDGATIPCIDPDVEWSHARIYYDRGRYWIEDLQSRGGVRVNERPVLHRSLREDDVVSVGSVQLRFSMNGAAPAGQPDGGSSASGEEQDPASGGWEPPDHAGAAAGWTATEPPSAAPRDVPTLPDEHSGGGGSDDSTESMVAAVTAAGDAAAAAGSAISAGLTGSVGAESATDEAGRAGEGIEGGGGAPEADEAATPLLAEPPSEDLPGLQAENKALRERVAQLDRCVRRKQTGLNLATESFVEQLERAKERIQSFATRYAESEDRARKQADQITQLQAENARVAAQGQGRVDALTDKLEAVRRDFEEIERVLRRKAQGYAKMVSEARAMRQQGSLTQVASTPIGADSAALLPAAEGGGRPPRPSGIQPVAVELEEEQAEGVEGAEASRPAPEEGRLALSPEDDEEAGSPRDRRRGPRMRLATVASIFAALFCFAFMLLLLIKGWSRPVTRSVAAIGELSPERPAAPGTRFPAAKATPRPRGASKRAPRPGGAPKAAPKPKPEAVAAASTASAEELIAALRTAHRSRDRARIAQEEKALISRGSSILEAVRQAYQKEKQFQLKVSLQYVLLALEGGGGAQTVIDRMRSTRDAGEKMRLAFMLLKLGDQDLPAIETALQSEQDPMVRKYLIRSLGGLSSGKGVQTLAQVARQGTDRQQRIEAIRALERQRSPEVAQLLVDLSTAEQGRDAQIRSIAVRALANVAGRDQSPFFGGVLQQDQRTNNRAEAARFFGRVGSAEDLPMLEGALQQERIYYIRQKIEKAVQQIKKRSGAS